MRLKFCLHGWLVALLACAPACSQHSALPETQPLPAGGLQPRFAPILPAPPALLADLPIRSASAAILSLTGSQYTAPFAARATAEGSALRFSPAWIDGSSPFSDVAYAVYRFNTEAYSGPLALELTWAEPPASGELWIGLSRWSAGRWDWYPGSPGAGGVLNLLAPGYASYANPLSADLLVAIVLAGEPDCALSSLRIGNTQLYEVSGHVRLYSGAAVPGALISFSGGLDPVQTDASGLWVRSGVLSGTYSATCTKDGCAFQPSSRNVQVVDGDVTVPDFFQVFTLSGDVRSLAGRPLAGVTITFTGGLPSVETDQDGHWSRNGVLSGSYTVTPQQSGSIFVPLSQDIQVVDSDIQLDDFTLQAWAHTWGGVSPDWASGMAVDADGNAYVTGYTSSFGAGSQDAILMKYDALGRPRWAYTWGGNGSDGARAVALDPNGNAFVAGYTASFGAGSQDSLLLKYNESGTLLWQRTWGGSNEDWPDAIVVDGGGNVYVAGQTWSYGPGNTASFLLKYSAAGTLLWQKTWGGSSWSEARALARGADGGIYVAGVTGSFDNGSGDCFLIKYSSLGALLWQKTWGGDGWDGARALAVNASSVYVSGFTTSYPPDPAQCFILLYDTAGALLRQSVWGGSYQDEADELVLDPSGNLFVAGLSGNSAAGTWDALLLKFDAAGALLSQQVWDTDEANAGLALWLDAGGALYMAGYAPNNTGSWGPALGTLSSATLLAINVSGTAEDVSGEQSQANGQQHIPGGVQDSGGGEQDLLVMLNAAP